MATTVVYVSARRRAPRPPSKRHSGQTREVLEREAAVIAERRVRALQYRLAGASYRKIAKELQVSVETAWSDVQAELRALREIAVHDAEELRELEMQRLDEWTLNLTPKARDGDPRAIGTLVRIQERRAKLTGLDAPDKVEHTGKDGAPIAVQHAAIDLLKFATESELAAIDETLRAWAERAEAES